MSLAPIDIPALIGLIIIVTVSLVLLIFIIIEIISTQRTRKKIETYPSKIKVLDYFAEQDKKMD
ncbi:MAG: hypothetical protein ACFFDW_05140 [Candidatus Thorarchaeota archaeon]